MVLNTLFGDGMSSRLNQQIRERHGLSAFSECPPEPTR
jgi:predicted Zn-dependent peptidase